MAQATTATALELNNIKFQNVNNSSYNSQAGEADSYGKQNNNINNITKPTGNLMPKTTRKITTTITTSNTSKYISSFNKSSNDLMNSKNNINNNNNADSLLLSNAKDDKFEANSISIKNNYTNPPNAAATNLPSKPDLPSNNINRVSVILPKRSSNSHSVVIKTDTVTATQTKDSLDPHTTRKKLSIKEKAIDKLELINEKPEEEKSKNLIAKSEEGGGGGGNIQPRQKLSSVEEESSGAKKTDEESRATPTLQDQDGNNLLAEQYQITKEKRSAKIQGSVVFKSKKPHRSSVPTRHHSNVTDYFNDITHKAATVNIIDSQLAKTKTPHKLSSAGEDDTFINETVTTPSGSTVANNSNQAFQHASAGMSMSAANSPLAELVPKIPASRTTATLASNRTLSTPDELIIERVKYKRRLKRVKNALIKDDREYDYENSEKLSNKEKGSSSKLVGSLCCLCILLRNLFTFRKHRKSLTSPSLSSSSSLVNTNFNNNNNIKKQSLIHSRFNTNTNSVNNSTIQLPNDYSSTNNATTSNQRRTCCCCCNCLFMFVELALHNRKLMYRKMRDFLVGSLIAVIVCTSFVLMTYLLRRTLNLVEDIDKGKNIPADYFNSTYDGNKTNTSYYHFMLNIESSNGSNMTLTCDFCYLIVWTSSSVLLLLYPFYFAIYVTFFLKRARRRLLQKSTSMLSDASKQSAASGHHPSVANQSPTPPSSTTTASPNHALTLKELFLNSLNVFREDHKTKTKLLDNLLKHQNSQNNTTSNILSHSTQLSTSMMIFKLKKREYASRILLITLIWVITGYSYLRAIDLLFCSDLIVLFSVNFSLIYMGQWIFLQQKFIPIRLLGFILSVAAIIFTYYAEGFLFNLKFLGNFCATTSAVGSALLQIIWNYNTKDKKNHQRIMLLSQIGLCNFLFGWPLIILLRLTGIESSTLGNLSTYDWFTFEVTKRVLVYVLGASFLCFIYIFLLGFGPMFTRVVFLQVGCILVVPVAVAMDMQLNNLILSDLKIGAIIAIVIGYMFLILPENIFTDFRNKFCPEPIENVGNATLTRRYKQSAVPSSPNNNQQQQQQTYMPGNRFFKTNSISSGGNRPS